MELYLNLILENPIWIVMFLTFILLLWNIILTVRISNVKKRVTRFTRGANTNNLEQLIEMYSQEFGDLKANIERDTKKIDIIDHKLKSYKGKASIVRYNAFAEDGNDLSYSIAFLDENKNGIVISSIFNRGQSNTYAKPIVEGTSKYKLSTEELLAIENAFKE